MKITITGSLGNISKPLAEELIRENHSVTVVSSSQQRLEDIEKMGAKAAIGSLEDAEFLASAFSGSDAVYCMVPPNDREDNQVEYYRRIGRNYKAAIEKSGVKKVVFLSSWGAHRTSGTGIILGSHEVEEIFSALPKDISVIYLRPTSIMYNIFSFSEMIRQAGFIGTNYGGDDFISWVHPEDIAEAAAEELLKDQNPGTHIVYVASDEMTATESAKIIGEAIGKPDLEWKLLPKESVVESLKSFGMLPGVANAIADLNESMHNGALAEDYLQNKPTLRSRKFRDFVAEFAKKYNQE